MKELFRKLIIIIYTVLRRIKHLFVKNVQAIHIGFLSEEFFHEDLRSFGGYGMTIKYITDHFNTNGNTLKGSVLLTYPLNVPRIEKKQYHNADVIVLPKDQSNYVVKQLQYCQNVHALNLNTFISIDYFGSYEYALESFPTIPWIIWLKDPRDRTEWEKIFTVELEAKSLGNKEREKLIAFADRQAESLNRVIKQARRWDRKIYFAAEIDNLTDIARRQFGRPDITATHLPKAIPFSGPAKPSWSQRPSFLFIGRLDPVKRPWIYFKLAKHFPEADFYVAGKTHCPEIMNPVLNSYNNVPNLKFLAKPRPISLITSGL